MTTADRPLVGVGVAVRKDDSVLLVQRGREPAKGLWAVPGGKVERGETLAETATREVKEETGLDVELGEVIWVGEVVEDDYHIVLIDFDARPTGGSVVAADDAVDARWVSLDDALSLPLTNTMYDLIETLRQ